MPAEGQPPAADVGEPAGEQAADHPAEGGAADVEAGRPRVAVRVHLLAQVGHGDGGQSGERDALSSARSTSSAGQLGATAHSSADHGRADQRDGGSARCGRPPPRPARPPAAPSPRPTVLSETDSVLWPADTEKSRASSGSSGWVL